MCCHLEVVVAVALVGFKRTLAVDRLGEQVVGAQVAAGHEVFNTCNHSHIGKLQGTAFIGVCVVVV